MKLLLLLLAICLPLAYGQQYPLHLLSKEEYPEAQCLDGSMAGFYYRVSNSSKNWVIWHQGGGWCYNIAGCYSRASTALGTSTMWPQTISFGGVMSSNPTVNPGFYTWNAIYMYYCDGSSFSSHNDPVEYKDITLHFRGKDILSAIFKELTNKFGLDQAQNAIITGSSAGGLATYLHLDWWASVIAGGKAHVVGLPDAGWFIDAPNTKGVYVHTNDMKSAWTMFNSSGFVNSGCVKEYTGADSWKCFYAQYTYPFIKSPLFVWNSRFDSWQADNILQLGCNPLSNNCSPTQLEDLDNYGLEFMKTIAPVLQSKKDGYFLDACFYHTGNDWSGVLINDLTLGQSFTKWYDGTDIRAEDDCPQYPCNPTCPK